jgi:hypothetical protein
MTEQPLATGRRTNRTYSLLFGVTTGIVWVIFARVLKFDDQIESLEFVPFYMRGALSSILFPMAIGAVVSLAYILLSRKVAKFIGMSLPVRTFEGITFGAVGAVMWWVVPLATAIAMAPLIFVASVIGNVVTFEIAKLIYGSPTHMPHIVYDIGWYVGGALVGSSLGAGICVFSAGVIRALLGKLPWSNKGALAIAATLGVVVGAIYSSIYVWASVVNGLA